jgi:preprotein translocase subunit SecG
VLLQRSEGGALGSGSPTGLITTRGAGDLLTRTTWVLFTLFLVISLALTLLGGRERSSQSILNRLKNQSINPDALPAPAAAPGTTNPPPLLAPARPAAPPVPAQAPPATFAAPVPTVRSPSARRPKPSPKPASDAPAATDPAANATPQ